MSRTGIIELPTDQQPGEPRTLEELKKVVETNLNATLECGLALFEIKTRKLYLEECGSFEEFVAKNWGVSRSRAYQLINYAEIMEDLKFLPDASTAVDSERAARELKKVPREKRASVLDKAKGDNGKATGPSIAAAAREASTIELDRTGFAIPPESPAMATWNFMEEIQKHLTNISQVKSLITRAQESRDIIYAEINYPAIIADLTSCYSLFKVALPYAVCPACQGRVLSPCTTCSGRGMVSEAYWKHKITKETKALRAKVVQERNA